MAIFMSYCPRFLVPIGFARNVRPVTFLRDMTRNSSFSRFMAVFMSYCPQLGVLGRFTVTFRPDTCWKDMTRNSSFSCFMAVFMSYCPQFRGSRAIYSDLPTWYMLEIYDQKLAVLVFYGRFHELLPTV